LPPVRSDTRKKMGRTKSTIVFKVSCDTDLPKFAPCAGATRSSVYRRYSQFRWLHQQLAEKYPGVPRPSLPPKVKVGGLEKRSASLSTYMTRLVEEPSFLLSTELLIFLTADDACLLDAMQIPALPFLKYGWEAMNKNNTEKASIWFGQALQSYIVRKDITGQFQSLRFLGEVCQLQERWTAAAKTYRQLLKVAQQMDDHEGAAIALINMARCCHQLKDFNTSVSCLTEMFERAGEHGQLHLQAVALRNIGMVHASLFDYAKAIRNFRDELKLRDQLGDPEESMKACEAVGLMLFRMFDVQGAIGMFESYLSCAEDYIAQGRREGYSYKGLALLGLGTFHDYLGENETAIEKLNESLSMFESLNDDQNATVVMNNIGIYYRRVCRFSDAEKYFRSAYSISKDNRDLEMQTRCLRNLALVANRNDDFGRSMTLIAECVQLAENLDDQRLLAQAYRTQADVFSLVSDTERAQQLYTICEGICKGTEDKVELARCLCGLGELAAGRQDPDNARALQKFEQSLKISMSIGFKKGIALANYGTGLIHRRLGNFAVAAESLHESAENFKKTGNAVMHCRALAQYALCKCYDGIYDQALASLSEAKEVADPVRDKQGVVLITDTQEVVEQLELLLGKGSALTIKAQRELTLGEYKTVTVGVLVTLTQDELRIVGDGKKASSKLGAEQVDLTVRIEPSMKIDLGRGDKSKFLIVRTNGREDLMLACEQRSLLYTVLNVLATKQRTCGGQTIASGKCLSSMRVGVAAEMTIQAKLASGEASSTGGDSFQVILRRKAPLPGEPVYSPVDAPEFTEEANASGIAEQFRHSRLNLGRGEAYDISEGPTIIINDDGMGDTATAPVRVKSRASRSKELVAEWEVTDNDDGSYACTIVPQFSGQCTLDVLLNGLPIQGSPFMPEVVPAALCPAKCDIPNGALAARGRPTHRLLCLRDEFGNQLLDCGDDLRVIVTYKGGELAVTNRKDGTFSFSYDAGTTSGGQLLAMVNGITVEDCPLIVALEDEDGMVSQYAASSSHIKGQNDLITTIEQTIVALTSVTASPESFAFDEANTESSESTIVKVEQQASSLLGDLRAVIQLTRDSRDMQLPAVASTVATLRDVCSNDSQVPLSGGLDPQLRTELAQAEKPYQDAQSAVNAAVYSNRWGEVARQVETRAACRSNYMAVLRRAIDVPQTRDGAALARDELAMLLESVPAAYGSQEQASSDDTDAPRQGDVVAAFNAWQTEANSSVATALHEFTQLCSQVQHSARDSVGLWVSLTSAGKQSVDALIESLQPMADALRDASSRISEGVPPAGDEDDDDEDEEEAVLPGPLAQAVTGAIVAGLPRATEMCSVFQQWSTAANEATAAQQKHQGLCAQWTSQASRLGAALKQCAETGRSAGPNVIGEARRRLAHSAVPGTEDLRLQLRNLVDVEKLEETMPDLEMEFHALAMQDQAAQTQHAPALVSKLQSLLDAGFVEITVTLERAKSLLPK
jgi:tetratricopeptide (TPR) repeat protein